MSDERHFLHVKDVDKVYGAKRVLDNVDLKVREGELCTLVGPSGCGKSTLLRLILGEERATAGQVLLDGRPVGTPDIHRGIVFQRYSLFPHLTVLSNVTLGLKLSDGKVAPPGAKTDIREQAMTILRRVRLEEHWNKFPHQLSGGMQQRVAIAQSLIMRPRILLMDEPFGALDPDTREDMQLFLIELWEERGMTIFFVTHDLAEAAFLGTRILVLSQYYTDDRGDGDEVNRGAKIVADHPLGRTMLDTGVKHSSEFGKLIETLRAEGFDPEYRQHAREFDLRHSDSYRTLRAEEHRDT